MMNALTNCMKRHPLPFFFLTAYALSWAIWLPLLLQKMGAGNVPASPYLHLLGGLGPMLAAMIMAWATAGRAGLRGYWKRMIDVRAGRRWHLLAWLSPLAVYAAAALIVRLVWGAWPDPGRLGQSEEYPRLPILVYWAATILFYGWGEESGWRGYALPLLQKKRTARSATFLLSIFWALWHLPLFGFVDGYTKMGLGGAIGWYASMLLSSVIFTWLFNSTRGSILIPAVFHGVADIVFNSPSPGDLATVVGVWMTLWGIVLLIRFRSGVLSQTGTQTVIPGEDPSRVEERMNHAILA